ncbi:aminotransferase class III-fold pyridoxal phosphate-dependent enzyme [Xanthobacter autotrophicus DSM 431]|uniref:aminotransferase class III-fold pyridoxal phosphate-dependent enzyme n=1 Tax=Xanthobacter nonsaccharivorans TaxID=3119912 RepID=UPI00372A1698
MPDDRDSASLTHEQEQPAPEGPAQAEAAAVSVPLDFSGACPVLAVDEEGLPVDPSRFADLLIAHSFGDAAVPLPSAGVARQVMLETLRAHHRIAGRPKRRHLIVCAGAGDVPLPPEFAGDAEVSRVPDDMVAIGGEIGPRTAGILVSPVRLSAGLEMLPGSFLADLREAADEYGLVLAFDETDGGLGRTGMAFSHEWTGVTPDLMLLRPEAGLGVAALVLTAKLARALPARRPEVDEATRAGAAEALAQAFAPGFEGRVQALGWQLEDRLATLRYRRADLFEAHVGTGLMQGLVCRREAADLAQRLATTGLLVRPLGNVLAFLPPLAVDEGGIDAAARMLEQAVAELEPVPVGA